MARRQIVEEPVSHDRWLVSYADFITLLFAFFVVMYSISQVNEGKYKVLSSTLTDAFSSQTNIDASPELTLDPFQVGELNRSNPRHLVELESSAILENQGNTEGDGEGEIREQGGFPEELQRISNRIDEGFGKLIDNDMITVRGNEEWLEVELKSSLLFDSGDARLSPNALGLLASIADILRAQKTPVRVEGFTDDVPINTVLFPSNWELSAARASAVVQLFIEEGLDPARFAATGYGEFQPIADNSTEAGRLDNRRVVLMISKTGELRPDLREVATVQQLLDQPIEQPSPVVVEIIIPGVEPAQSEAGIPGVKTIELEGGGLLFTRDPDS